MKSKFGKTLHLEKGLNLAKNFQVLYAKNYKVRDKED